MLFVDQLRENMISIEEKIEIEHNRMIQNSVSYFRNQCKFAASCGESEICTYANVDEGSGYGVLTFYEKEQIDHNSIYSSLYTINSGKKISSEIYEILLNDGYSYLSVQLVPYYLNESSRNLFNKEIIKKKQDGFRIQIRATWS